MKKMKSYILPILLCASFAFNPFTSNAMHMERLPFSLEIPEETRNTLRAFSQEIRHTMLTFPRESCRSLLLLGTGVAGLILLTGTIRHIINTEKEVNHNSEALLTNLLAQASSLGRYGLGIGTGVLFLGAGFWGLNSNVNFTRLFAKTLPSCLQTKPEEEKQD
ncbi:hypothetical protein E3J79_03650 [Candidatus Dependentiae bacterium]|nr:MAG: hypothetical protein E3J79_03650 [Candidatus Dependentiae bacterium]